MLIIRNLTYKINSINTIFENVSFSIADNEKVALVGKNGIGKSILLSLIVAGIKPYSGEVIKNGITISYFPQKFNELNFNTIADVFGLEKQVISLKKVDDGVADVDDYENLDGHWDCVEIINDKMKFFGLKFDLLRYFSTLSGGEKVKLILSSIISKNSNFLVLDEPTNNMDYESKRMFYEFVRSWNGGILLVSHDRELLNIVDKIFELRRIGMKDTKLFAYGGNYECWRQQKSLEENALEEDYNSSIRKLEKQKKQTIEDMELVEKKKKQGKAGLEKKKYDQKAFGLKLSIAQDSFGKVANRNNRSLTRIDNELNDIKDKREIKERIYFKFPQNKFPNKVFVNIEDLMFFYGKKRIFNDFNFQVNSGDRISIEGRNGSGKTTLFKIIMGKITDYKGKVKVSSDNIVYLDQSCDFLFPERTILENMKICNSGLNEEKCRNILAEFLFRTDVVFKKVSDLSGGEKLRVALACILAKESVPQMILLDEPTNNMDLDSVEILEKVLTSYNGTIIVISHDQNFKNNIRVDRVIKL